MRGRCVCEAGRCACEADVCVRQACVRERGTGEGETGVGTTEVVFTHLCQHLWRAGVYSALSLLRKWLLESAALDLAHFLKSHI